MAYAVDVIKIDKNKNLVYLIMAGLILNDLNNGQVGMIVDNSLFFNNNNKTYF